MQYRRCGASELQLSVITLGLMVRDCAPGAPYAAVRETVLEAIDSGITSIDLATGYGGGTVEQALGKILRENLPGRRGELVLATKAGWADGTRATLTTSLEKSLQQLGVDYVDIYYHHAPDANTPLEETVQALDDLVRQGKTRYVGVSNYSPQETRRIVALFRQAGTPCIAHEANYNLLNRWVEDELLQNLSALGMSVTIFAALAQGILTERGAVEGSRAAATFHNMVQGVAEGEPAYGVYPPGDAAAHANDVLARLKTVAHGRGQTLSQLAVAWVLRQPGVATVMVGTSNAAQLRDTIGAVDRLGFTSDELANIAAIIPPRPPRVVAPHTP